MANMKRSIKATSRADAITKARERSGMTRGQFAEQLGVSRMTLHRYETASAGDYDVPARIVELAATVADRGLYVHQIFRPIPTSKRKD